MDKKTRELIDRLAERWNKEIVEKHCGLDFTQDWPWQGIAVAWVLGAGLSGELAVQEDGGFVATCQEKKYTWEIHQDKNSRNQLRNFFKKLLKRS